jgi:hypothetical protein
MKAAKDFEEFFASCNRHRVEYLVVGGYAFAVHAHPRYTGDMDIFIRPSESYARRILSALKDFGFVSPSLTPRDLATLGRVVQIGFPPLRIDLLTEIDGVGFDDAWARRVKSTYGKRKIHLISKEDLTANKFAL